MTQVVTAAPASGELRTARHGARPLDRWTLALAALSAALVGLGWEIGWRGVDLPAQLYRVEQFRAHGFSLWDSQWYAGHWALDYSVLYPALGAWIGVGLLAALSAALGTASFHRILTRAFGTAARPASTVFAIGVIVETSIGQLAFFTGVAFGLACLWALLGPRRRWVIAGVLALASTSTSPLAGAFLALALAAWWLATVLPPQVRRPPHPGSANPRPTLEVERSRRGEVRRIAVICVLALAPIAITTVLFPGQGPMPYPFTDWLWETAVALLAWTVAPRRMQVLRTGIVLYLLALLGSVSVPSALGGNVGRMEDAFALPVVAACCWGGRDPAGTAWPLGRWLQRVAPSRLTRGFRIALAGVAVPLVLSQWGPAAQALTANAGRSWTHGAYYAPLAAWLAGELDTPPSARVEVVPSLDHWEAAFVAPSVPLARGWDRQLDVADNPLFYGKAPLNPQAYLGWLKGNGIRYVALAGAPLDAAGVAESRLLAAGVPGTRPVWHNANWQVWEVIGASGLVSGPARLTSISDGRVNLVAAGSGATLVRVRWAAHWRVASGAARLAEATGGWTTVIVEAPGPISLRASLGE